MKSLVFAAAIGISIVTAAVAFPTSSHTIQHVAAARIPIPICDPKVSDCPPGGPVGK